MSDFSCSECDSPAVARSLCRKHYDYHRRAGTLRKFAAHRKPGPFDYGAWKEKNRKRLRAYNREWMRRYRAASKS